jgi:hypothetical protein
LFFFLHIYSGSGLAIPIAYTGSQLITSSGQTFLWDKDVVKSTGAGSLIIESAGDYNYQGTESSSIFIDDIFKAEGLGLSYADYIEESTPSGHYWIKEFSLSSDIISMITNDLKLSVRITNTSEVDPIYENGFVKWSLSYETENNIAPVPEPTTIVLLGVGLFGMAISSRKKIKK